MSCFENYVKSADKENKGESKTYVQTKSIYVQERLWDERCSWSNEDIM